MDSHQPSVARIGPDLEAVSGGVNCIPALGADEERRYTMGRAGRTFVANHFDKRDVLDSF